MEFGPRKSIVVDTGVLLIHALGGFEGGRYVEQACGFLHEKDNKVVARELSAITNQILSASLPLLITPHAFTEFFALLEREMHSKGRRTAELLEFYKQTLLALEDIHLPKNDIVTNENLPRFGIADVATILAGIVSDAIIVSVDYPLVQWCRSNSQPALHLYYDVYLQS